MVYVGKKLWFFKFSFKFYEISYSDSRDIIRTHNYGFAFFGSKMCFLTISSLEATGLLQKLQYLVQKTFS